MSPPRPLVFAPTFPTSLCTPLRTFIHPALRSFAIRSISYPHPFASLVCGASTPLMRLRVTLRSFCRCLPRRFCPRVATCPPSLRSFVASPIPFGKHSQSCALSPNSFPARSLSAKLASRSLPFAPFLFATRFSYFWPSWAQALQGGTVTVMPTVLRTNSEFSEHSPSIPDLAPVSLRLAL